MNVEGSGDKSALLTVPALPGRPLPHRQQQQLDLSLQQGFDGWGVSQG